MWKEILPFEEIIFEYYNGIAKITINRPRYRNAFTPLTVSEMSKAFYNAFYKDKNLVVIRYPRGRMPADTSYTELCSADYEIIGNPDAETAIVTYGRLFFNAEKALKLTGDEDKFKIIKLNRIKPIPVQAVEAALGCKKVFFFEEGMRGGGVGEKFGCELLLRGFGSGYKLVAVEDEFVAHASVERLMEKYSMSPEKMALIIKEETAV